MKAIRIRETGGPVRTRMEDILQECNPTYIPVLQ